MANDTTPKRIASFSRTATEILSYLNFSGEVTTLKEYFEDIPFSTHQDRPEYWFTMALARATSLKADLVFTEFDSQGDLHKKLKSEGFNALHLDPRTLRETEDTFLQVGRATGTYESARQMARDFSGGLAGLKEKIPPKAYRPKVYCEHWTSPPSAAGGWCAELLSEAGAHYFPMMAREMSRQARIQELLKFDPEIILFSVSGAGLGFNPSEVLKRIGWQNINAVRKRRIFSLDESLLNIPGPRLIEGAKVVQWIIGESYWAWPLVQSTFARRIQD